jgi:hypothetical protein
VKTQVITKFVAGIALAGCIASAPVAATGQSAEIDMSTVTCAQLLAMNQAAQSGFIFWIDGHLAGSADDLMLSDARVSANIAEVNRVCATSPNRSVLDIVRKYEESLNEAE